MIREGWMLVVWLTVLGAVIGSFLNVVVYRLPAGVSLIYPGSRCPLCGHAIRWYDNVPIVSWFLLRGRCRDCGAAFSLRYPAVEALSAVLFCVVAIATVLPGLADSEPNAAAPQVALETLLVRYAYWMTLVCGLVAAALIRFDGHRLPPRLTWFLLGAGIVLPLVWPEIRIPFQTRADALFDMAIGAVVGLTAAIVLAPLVTRVDASPGVAVELGAGLIVGGVYLGPWGVLVAGLGATALRLAAAVLLRRTTHVQRITWMTYLTATTLAWIVVGGGSFGRDVPPPAARNTTVFNWQAAAGGYTGSGELVATRAGAAALEDPLSVC